MSSHVQDVADLLFPTPDSSVLNVKFFRGSRSEVTADQLAEQVGIADAQVQDGTARVITNIDGPRQI